MHETHGSLHKHIDKALLPNEYGGSAGDVQTLADSLRSQLAERRAWFLEDGKYRTDETKRPGKPKNAEALFGTVGSFRTLEID